MGAVMPPEVQLNQVVGIQPYVHFFETPIAIIGCRLCSITIELKRVDHRSAEVSTYTEADTTFLLRGRVGENDAVQLQSCLTQLRHERETDNSMVGVRIDRAEDASYNMFVETSTRAICVNMSQASNEAVMTHLITTIARERSKIAAEQRRFDNLESLLRIKQNENDTLRLSAAANIREIALLSTLVQGRKGDNSSLVLPPPLQVPSFPPSQLQLLQQLQQGQPQQQQYQHLTLQYQQLLQQIQYVHQQLLQVEHQQPPLVQQYEQPQAQLQPQLQAQQQAQLQPQQNQLLQLQQQQQNLLQQAIQQHQLQQQQAHQQLQQQQLQQNLLQQQQNLGVVLQADGAQEQARPVNNGLVEFMFAQGMMLAQMQPQRRAQAAAAIAAQQQAVAIQGQLPAPAAVPAAAAAAPAPAPAQAPPPQPSNVNVEQVMQPAAAHAQSPEDADENMESSSDDDEVSPRSAARVSDCDVPDPEGRRLFPHAKERLNLFGSVEPSTMDMYDRISRLQRAMTSPEARSNRRLRRIRVNAKTRIVRLKAARRRLNKKVARRLAKHAKNNGDKEEDESNDDDDAQEDEEEEIDDDGNSSDDDNSDDEADLSGQGSSNADIGDVEKEGDETTKEDGSPACSKDFNGPSTSHGPSHNKSHPGMVEVALCQLCSDAETMQTDGSDNLNLMKEHFFSSHFDKSNSRCVACPSMKEADIVKHINKHTNKVYQCTFCGKRGRKNFLATHVRKHTGERPYQCETCERAFADKSTMRRHQLVHSGERKYQCPICPRMIARKDNVKAHLRSHDAQAEMLQIGQLAGTEDIADFIAVDEVNASTDGPSLADQVRALAETARRE